VSPSDLKRLFPEPSFNAPLLALLQEAGIDGFNFRSIVVLKDNLPVLLLPLFETRFDLSSFAEGWTRKILKVAGLFLPFVFQPRILGVGSMVGEWSEIGVDPHLDDSSRDLAFKMAFSALQTLATSLKSDIIGLYNFNHYGNLPEDAFTKFNQVQYRSSACLSIDFDSIEEYLGRLSRGARKDLRRKIRVAPQVRVVKSRDISPYLERIYKLYIETVTRGAISLGMHNRMFFEKICEKVPGAEYTLYFVEEELAAFNLLFINKEALVDKFFCMDNGLGRKYNLYALSWFENIRTCLERRVPFYYAGHGTEKTKAHMGAAFIPSFILFKHRQPAFDRLLAGQSETANKLLKRLGFWPEIPAFNNIPVKGEIEIHDQTS
jgi:hypothetical protein